MGDIMRIIMHIDVNNAFLSWSAIDLLNNGSKYDIRGSYAVIAGDPKARKGIVLAKSTPCKKLGIKTAMTLIEAKKLCPSLKVYPPNYSFYSKMSRKLFELLSKYTPDIEVASIDECYLDYTPVKNLYGDEVEFAKKIQQEIYSSLGFTVNIGIANNKLCAKMASDFTKPNKIHTLYEYEIETKMWPLEIGELFGIGKKTSEQLIKLNIKTIKDLANADVYLLSKYFKNQAINMINMARGIDDSKVNSEYIAPKGISHEITLINDVSNKEQLYPYLMELSEKVALRLRKQKKYAKVICVIIKDNYFKRKTHQKKLKNATNITSEIYDYTKEILKEMEIETVRLIGVRLDNLVTNNDYQVSLFDSFSKKTTDEKFDNVIDKLKDKYGNKIITKASLKDVNNIKKDIG